MIPILRGEEAAGVIKIASRMDHAFSQKDVELLAEVAAIAGATVLVSPLASQASLEIEESQALLKVSNGLVLTIPLSPSQAQATVGNRRN